jgi:hypothetical protein
LLNWRAGRANELKAGFAAGIQQSLDRLAHTETIRPIALSETAQYVQSHALNLVGVHLPLPNWMPMAGVNDVPIMHQSGRCGLTAMPLGAAPWSVPVMGSYDAPRLPGSMTLIMDTLLQLARRIDRLNESVGRPVAWLILIAVCIAVLTAFARKVGTGSNAFIEVQWYLFAAIFLLGGGVIR